MSKYKKLVLKTFVSLLLLGVLYFKVDRRELVETIKLLNFAYAPLIFLLLTANYVISSIRWKALLIHDGAEKVSVWYLTKLYFIGSFFNNFMPTSIGGDVYKIYRLGKKLNHTVNAFSATFMERFTGVILLVLISLFSMLKMYGLRVLLLLGLFFMGFFVGIKVLAVLSGRFTLLKKIHDSLYVYRRNYKTLAWALVTSLAVQIVAILTQYFVFSALGVQLPFVYSLIVLPMITLASFVIPSLNGIGVQDALYVQLFGVVGIPVAMALSASILYHLFRLVISLIGGLMYALDKGE